MRDQNDLFPLSIDCGKKHGTLSVHSAEELQELLRTTLPTIGRENDALTDENAALRTKIDELTAKIPKKQTPISPSPNPSAFVRRPNDRKTPTKIGELWDEEHFRRLDEKVSFDLSFPRGRYVTGFVGTFSLSYGSIGSLKSSLLWHDFYVDIKENYFWRGKVLVQRRSEDDRYNVRSLGLNEYVGR